MEASAIHEMANIGLGHAITALSDLTGRSFNIDVPRVSAASLERVPELVGDTDEAAVGIYMAIDGDVSGHTAFIFPWESACNLWQMLIDRSPGDFSEIDELAASAMLETGNIITSCFMDAIADMADLRMLATPPLVSIDNCRSIVSSIVAEAELSESVALIVETKIFELEGRATQGYFLCIPSKDSIEVLFENLQLKESA